MGVFSVPEDVAIKAGVKKGDVRIPAGYAGSGEYMVSLELTHQLHCVVSATLKKSYRNGTCVFIALTVSTPTEFPSQGRMVQLSNLQGEGHGVYGPG